MRKLIFAAVFIFSFVALVSAETTIKAEVDKTTLTTDDTLTYKIVIASSEKKLPAPQIPKFEGFNIISQAQSSTVSFMKTELKTILVYAFILAPNDIGKFKIAPASIKVKDKIYTSDTFEIEISQGAKPLPEEKPALPEEIQPELEEPQVTL